MFIQQDLLPRALFIAGTGKVAEAKLSYYKCSRFIHVSFLRTLLESLCR